MAIAVPLIVPAARIILALAARTAVRAAFSKIASDIQTLFNDGPPDSVRQCKAEQKDKTQSGSASGGPEQDPEEEPNKGGLKKLGKTEMEKLAKEDGYDSVEAWKQRELRLNSRSELFKDKYGNVYYMRRGGFGEPQPLWRKIPR